ncbi:hypothetical protein ACJX0J_005478, partial [Zea mays]
LITYIIDPYQRKKNPDADGVGKKILAYQFMDARGILYIEISVATSLIFAFAQQIYRTR